MAHKHHILPKYKGGTDSPENLVEVSVTRHAMFHYCNWKLWGDKRDWLAWKGLVGEIPRTEIARQLILEGSKKGGKTRGECPKNKERMRELGKRMQPKATLAAKSPEAIARRKETLEKIKHSQGDKNSQYGTMWVTDGEINRKIKKQDPIPEGFRKGRVIKGT